MKKSKMIVMMFIITAILISAGNVVFAVAPDVSGLSMTTTDDKIFSIGEKGLGVVAYVCYGAAVIILLVLGAQFMFASPDGKAEIKKKSIAYAIGGFILFAAGTIVKIVQGVTNATIS